MPLPHRLVGAFDLAGETCDVEQGIARPVPGEFAAQGGKPQKLWLEYYSTNDDHTYNSLGYFQR